MTVARIPIPVETSAPGGTTNAYLVGEESALLVDPAAPSDDLDAVVADRDVAHVAVTHTHADHVGAVAAYADRTGATMWARRGREDRFERATGVQPDRTFVEGTTIRVGDDRVTVLDTPGHASDHVSFAIGGGHSLRRHSVLCGDLAVARGSVVVGAPEGDLRGYLTALRRLHARNPRRMHPGHGPTIQNPRVVLERLIDHRLDRERRVLDAVRAGARDPDAVVDAAYDKDVEHVRDLARATVVAHVEKLAVEGRVRWDVRTERVEPV